ncbi:MAG: Ig-like domain-containing protein [Burkholderiales bacterium]|nr:Ig-like domain-containing protein [Burkholderiales bacterium]
MLRFAAPALALAVLAAAVSSTAFAAGPVRVLSDTSHPLGSIFPSNRYTTPDFTQNTQLRIVLPKPDCAVRPSDCADIDVLNTLDGFSTQPRVSVPFSGAIDPATVTSDTVFLVNLGDTLTGRGFGERVGINQVIWSPAGKRLAFQSDQLLQQHSRYAVVVTDGVRDTEGHKIGGDFGQDAQARAAVPALQLVAHKIVAIGQFTTQSITADLTKINARIKASTPGPINFVIGHNGVGPVRAVFPVAGLAGILFNRQTGAAPAFTTGPVPTPALQVVPGAVASVAYGRFASPSYWNTAARVIPPTGSLTGVPAVQGSESLLVQMFVPAGPKPAGGWPVVIFGHGFTDSMYGAPWTVASVFASRGIATVSINVTGHGGGAMGTLTVVPSAPGAPPVSVPAGGRGIDQDGNGTIDSTEGVGAVGALSLVSSRDGLRQTVIDLMQLVRQIEAGVDIDGDASIDLDANRIYYSGQSFGGIYGTIFLGTEPSLKAGVPNVPGGSITEIARLSPNFRILTAIALATRQPTLINLPPLPNLPVPLNLVFNENIPLRNLAPLTDTVPGAEAIQHYIDVAQWATQAGNPVSYAPHIRKQPLPGHAAKPVIFQFAKGDVTVPNPTTSAILRAGELADRATYFRNDLAYAMNVAVGRNPHTFLTNIGTSAQAPYAVMAQQQVAIFLASHGTMVIDPDGAGPFFEVPIAGPLPEQLNFIP